ncbi:hypothetical protein CASFOL_003817 [Castilleja foliolosa]|uniref:RING-CH-type domain-containing protein n=1 Tax=Castilleja foliolosa TaxID=1961234 RepID=A0ABD3EIV1_9LAMI
MDKKENSDLDLLSDDNYNAEMEEPYLDVFRPMSAQKPRWGNISEKKEFFLVKVTAEISGHDRGEKIAKMEAICKVCDNLLHEAADISVLKTKCRCRLSLVHEKCYTQNPANKHNNQADKCDVCTEIIEYIPVTLSRSDDGPPAGDHLQLPESSKRSNKWFSWFTRRS